MGRVISFTIGVFILTFLVSALFDFDIIGDSKYIYQKESSKYKELVGEDILLSGDTLKVVDYSLINNNVRISNGVEVNYLFAKRNVLK